MWVGVVTVGNTMEGPRKLKAQLWPNSPTPAHIFRQNTVQTDAHSPRVPAALTTAETWSNVNACRLTAKREQCTRSAASRNGAAPPAATTGPQPESTPPSEARKRAANARRHRFHGEPKPDKNEPVCEADTESPTQQTDWGLPKWRGLEGGGVGAGASGRKPSQRTADKALLHRTGDYTQYPVINCNGKGHTTKDAYA